MMRLRPVLLLPLILLISSCSSLVRYPKMHRVVKPSELGRTFTTSQLKADLDFMFQTLTAVHPNLYAYTKDSVIQRERGVIEQRLNRPMTRLEFYREIAPLVALLKDGHTSVIGPDEEWNEFQEQGGLLFPFDLDVQTDHTCIKVNYSNDTSIAPGMELLAINGKPMQEIVSELTKYISAERLVTKYEYLENRFRFWLWLIYQGEGPFDLGIRTSGGLLDTIKVRGITLEDFKAKLNQPKKEKPAYYSYRCIPEIKAGLIDFRSFWDYNQFKEFLEKTFVQMKADGAENLIIDIRQNPGGNSTLGDLLLTYLTDKPFCQYSQMDIKVSKQIKRYYRQFLRWYIRWLPFQWFHPWIRKIWSTPEGDIVIFKEEPKKHKTNKLLFDGDIYVLISSYTFSSATDFAATIKDFQIGTLIGEETGGLATSYGDIYFFDLPNTHISVGVSHKRFVRPSGKDDGRGVLPDYEVSQTQEGPAKSKDAVLEFTKQLIKAKKL